MELLLRKGRYKIYQGIHKRQTQYIARVQEAVKVSSSVEYRLEIGL